MTAITLNHITVGLVVDTNNAIVARDNIGEIHLLKPKELC